MCVAEVSQELPPWNVSSRNSVHSSQQTVLHLAIGGDEGNVVIQEGLFLLGSPAAVRQVNKVHP